MSSTFHSGIFQYDDPSDAKNLHTFVKGKASSSKSPVTKCWFAESADYERDLRFNQYDLFGNQNVMAQYADGKARKPSVVEEQARMWKSRFENGHPHGGNTVFLDLESMDADSENQYLTEMKNKFLNNPQFWNDFSKKIQQQQRIPIGHVGCGNGDESGHSEFYHLYLVEFQQQGFGSSILETMTRVWAPEVRRIGMGNGLDPIQDAKIIQAFNCFGPDSNKSFLKVIDATAGPANKSSWILFDKQGFKPGKPTKLSNLNDSSDKNEEIVIDFEGKEFSSIFEMQDTLMELYDQNSLKREEFGLPLLKKGILYQMIDTDGKQRTVSRSIKFDTMKYHFQKDVV